MKVIEEVEGYRALKAMEIIRKTDWYRHKGGFMEPASKEAVGSKLLASNVGYFYRKVKAKDKVEETKAKEKVLLVRICKSSLTGRYHWHIDSLMASCQGDYSSARSAIRGAERFCKKVDSKCELL